MIPLNPISSDGEEHLFSDHIYKSLGVTELQDMRLTRSKAKLSLSNCGDRKRKSSPPSRRRGRGRPNG